MPELPEVETIRRGLGPLLAGTTVVDAWGHPSPKFRDAVAAVGRRVEGVGRRGKYLLFDLDGRRELVVHLGMTGQLAVVEHLGPLEHVRAWWALDDGRVLRYRDVRRFGRLGVVPRGEHSRFPTLAAQGPEPWDTALDSGGFWRRLQRSRAHLKTQLLSQRPIAGVGNIYADEALWRAGINPAVRSLGPSRAERLLTELRSVLEAGIANGGTTLRDYRRADGGEGEHQRFLSAYGRWGHPCERCGLLLRRRVIDGRTTTWCSRCQRR